MIFQTHSSSADEDFLICLNVLLKACEEKFIEIVFPCKLRRVFTSTVGTSSHGSIKFFSGCDQTDTKNLYCDGAGSITVLQVKAVMGTNDENSNKYVAPELSVGDTSIELPFAITVGRTNNLPINVNNFMITVTDKDGKNAKTYNVTLDGLFRTNLKNNDTATGKVKATVDALKAGDKVILTYCPDLQYAEYSMNWRLAVPAEETGSSSTTTK